MLIPELHKMLKVLVFVVYRDNNFFSALFFLLLFVPLDRFRPLFNRLNGLILRLSTSEISLYVGVGVF